jgi:hypothetical protein
MGGFIRIVVLLAVVFGGVYLYSGGGDAPTRPAVVTAPLPPPAARPASGVLENRTGRSLEAPFSINTSPEADYFLKLVDATTGRDAITIYVRGGQPLEVLVPFGSYRLRYASGETWRGPAHLFGPGELTSYNASDAVFNFAVSGGYVNGYRVELIRQVGGNMDTRRISPSQF